MNLFSLAIPDIKFTPYVQTAFNNYFSEGYRDVVYERIDRRWRIEDVRGTSNEYPHELYHYFAFLLGTYIYYEVSRGINTTYEYYDEKYDFDNIQKVFSYYNVDLNRVFAAYELFTGSVIYPSNIVISTVGGGTSSSNITTETITTSLIKGNNLITHGFDKNVVGITVWVGGFAKYFEWAKTHALITDPLNEIVIYSAVPIASCDIALMLEAT